MKSRERASAAPRPQVAELLAELEPLLAEPSALAWAQLGWRLHEAAASAAAAPEVAARLQVLAGWPAELRLTQPWIDVDDSPHGWWSAGCRVVRAPWLEHVVTIDGGPDLLRSAPARCAWRSERLHPRLTWRPNLDDHRGKLVPSDLAAALAHVPGIRRLHLAPSFGRRLTAAGWLEFLAASPAGQIRELRIDDTAVPRGVFSKLPGLSLAGALEVLCLRHAAVPHVDALVEAWPAGRLRGLDLAGTQLSAKAVQRVFAAPCVAGLEWLCLSVEAGAFEALLESSPPVVHLELQGARTTSAPEEVELARRAIAGLERLESLRLVACSLGDEHGAAIATTEVYRRLREIDLSDNFLGDRFVDAVVAGPRVPGLRIHLRGNEEITFDALERLRTWLGDPEALNLEPAPPRCEWSLGTRPLPPPQFGFAEEREVHRDSIACALRQLGPQRAVADLEQLVAGKATEKAWRAIGERLLAARGVTSAGAEAVLAGLEAWPEAPRQTASNIPLSPWWLLGCLSGHVVGVDRVTMIYADPAHVLALPEGCAWRTGRLHPRLRWWPGGSSLALAQVPPALEAVPGIRGLDLGPYAELDPRSARSAREAWTTLWTAPALRRLRSVKLAGQIGARGLDLGALPTLRDELIHLAADSLQGEHRGAWRAPLAAWGEGPLAALELSYAQLCGDDLAAWHGAPFLRRLVVLGLSCNNLTVGEAIELVASGPAERLEILDLCGARGGDAADWDALAAAAPSLRQVVLARALGDVGLARLAKSKLWSQLEHVCVVGCPLSAATLAAIVKDGLPPQLTTLELPARLATGEGTKDLRKKFDFAHVAIEVDSWFFENLQAEQIARLLTC